MKKEIWIKTFFYVLITTIFIFEYQIPIKSYAQESSSTQSADLQQQLHNLETEIASKAAKLKNQINQKLQNKAYVGFVSSVNSSNITIKTESGIKTVKYNQFTKTKGNGFSDISTLTSKDYVAALGDVDENDVMTAREIVLLPTYDEKDKDVFIGVIQQIKDRTITLSGTNLDNLTFNITSISHLKKNSSFIHLSDLKPGDKVAIIGFIKGSTTVNIENLYFIIHETPPTPTPNIHPVSTSSATITPKK